MNSSPESSPISLACRVRVNDGVLFQQLQDEAVLLNLDSGEYFGLDPVGTRIWQLIQAQDELSEILSTVLAEYEVEAARCEADLLKLVGEMQQQGLVRVVS